MKIVKSKNILVTCILSMFLVQITDSVYNPAAKPIAKPAKLAAPIAKPVAKISAAKPTALRENPSVRIILSANL